MSKIFHPEDYRIYKFNGNSYTAVYLGDFNNLQPVGLDWKIDKKNAEFTNTSGEYLTLKDIAEQIEEKEGEVFGKVFEKNITVFFITKNANSFIYTCKNGEWRMFDTNFNWSGGGIKDV